jgi:hypothetical protein
MVRYRVMEAALLLLLSVVLSDCGGTQMHRSQRQASPTGSSRASIRVWSPALTKRRVIPTGYTCALGAWLPLRWGALPARSRELALFFGSYSAPKALAQGGTDSLLVTAAGIVGLSPGAHQLVTGRLPVGARGISDRRIRICPARASGQEFVFELFALPTAGRVGSRSSRARASPLGLLSEIDRDAIAIGGFTARYG